MLGYSDGTLTWNDNDLAGNAIVEKLITTNGYIKYANGLIIQWLYNKEIGFYNPTITWSKPNTSNTYHLNYTLPIGVSHTIARSIHGDGNSYWIKNPPFLIAGDSFNVLITAHPDSFGYYGNPSQTMSVQVNILVIGYN